mmetsp:Transcript_22799/g.23745  ORF Transcript_22799/g.23745 Transcript_22799/m.23745 type:complete len:301 (+) Transcript_22799:2-904(+)
MELNSIIFPAPSNERIHNLSKYKDELLFIPKSNNKSGKEEDYIPCMLHECRKVSNSNKYMIYFHGNAEDIFNSNYTVDLTRTVLPYNTISVEYPGYSIYSEEKSSETIENDAIIVFDYLVKMGINEKDIIICGRSIGSGPSIYLSSNRKPGGLILISPFKSIQEVVKSIVGILKYLVLDRFSNIELVDKITCPTLFIHGQKDDIVPFDHSIELSKKCKCPIEIILPEEMDHNEIHIYDDFLEPVTSFLQRQSLLQLKEEKKIGFEKNVFEIPKKLEDMDSFKKNNNNDSVTKFIRKIFGV